MSSTLLTLALTLPAIFVFWTLSSTTSSPFARSFPRLYNKRICLLIAHPDDEAMFFAPTVLALTKPELGNHLKILCFSTGNAENLGSTRKTELQKSAKHLGLRSESDVFIVDDPTRFPDSMSASWSEDDIASILSSAFAPDLPSPIPGANTSISTATSTKSKKQNGSTSSNKPPLATIDVLLTFDKDGVSAHPNHRSLYHGARAFLRALMKDKPGFACPVSLYTLTSTNILRKYVGVLDAPISMVLGAASKLGALLGGSTSGAGGAGKGRRGQNEGASRLLFISSVGDWVRAQKAMVECHRSQMVWFRWGWITLGRYMAVNDLKRERIG